MTSSMYIVSQSRRVDVIASEHRLTGQDTERVYRGASVLAGILSDDTHNASAI